MKIRIETNSYDRIDMESMKISQFFKSLYFLALK